MWRHLTNTMHTWHVPFPGTPRKSDGAKQRYISYNLWSQASIIYRNRTERPKRLKKMMMKNTKPISTEVLALGSGQWRTGGSLFRQPLFRQQGSGLGS